METCPANGGRGPICGRRGFKPRLPDLPRERSAGACPPPGSRASGRWRGTGPRPTGEKMETCSRSGERGPGCGRRGLKPRLPDLPGERRAGACPPPGSRASGRWRGTGPHPTGEKMETYPRSGGRGPICRRRGCKPRLPDLPVNVGRGPVPRQVHARPDAGEGQALALRVKRWKPAHKAADEGPAAVGAV